MNVIYHVLILQTAIKMQSVIRAHALNHTAQRIIYYLLSTRFIHTALSFLYNFASAPMVQRLNEEI